MTERWQAFWTALGLLALALLVCLVGRAQAQTTQCVTNVAAQGTVNAITSAPLPCGTTTNLLLLTALGANTSTAVTYQPTGSPALPVTRESGAALAVGDIAGAGFVALLTSTGSSWVLLNPSGLGSSGTLSASTPVSGIGTGDYLYNNSGFLGGTASVPLSAITGLATGVPSALAIVPDSLGGFVLSPVASFTPRQIANVMAYGADPTGVTDSTTAIQNALNAAGNSVAPGCTYFPAGVYYVSGELDAPAHNGCIFGDSALSTTIMAYNSNSPFTNFNIGTAAVASGSWLTGATTITLTADCPVTLPANANVYDTTNWTIVGTINTCPSSGTTLTLNIPSRPTTTLAGNVTSGVTTSVSIAACPSTAPDVATWILDTTSSVRLGTFASCTSGTLTFQNTATGNGTNGDAITFLEGGAQADSSASADKLQLGGALGVLVLQPNTGGNGDLVHDIGFDFSQPQTSVRANIVPFPPAIKLYDHGRDRIEDVRVADSNICLDARTSGSTANPPDYTKSGGGGVFLDNLECGALTYGWLWDGAKDNTHWTDDHFWPFGTQLGGANALNTVYSDGTNVCFQNGRVDGLVASGVACFKGNAVFTANAGTSASGAVPDQLFVNLQLDNYSSLTVLGGQIELTGGHMTYPATATTPSITVNGTAGGGPVLRMDHERLAWGQQSGVRIAVSGGGKAYIAHSNVVCNGNATPSTVQCGTVSSGVLELFDNTIAAGSAGNYVTVPMFEQSSTGGLKFAQNVLNTAGANNVAQFDTDTVFNFLGGNQWNGASYTLPTTTSTGVYTDNATFFTDSGGYTGDGAADLHFNVNSPTAKAGYVVWQNAGVTEWLLGNLGASNDFILTDHSTSTQFMTVMPGGAATLGEGALLSFNGQFTDVGTHPTYTGTCPVQNFNGGSLAGRFQMNGACAAGTVIATFASSAAHGFTCDAHDITTPADTVNETAYSTNSVTLTGTMANSDVVVFKCIGF